MPRPGVGGGACDDGCDAVERGADLWAALSSAPPFSFFKMADNEHPVKRGRGRPAGAVQRWTVQQVADILSVPLQTVYTWTRQKCADGTPVLPTRKLGRLVRILQTDVERLEERLARRRPSSFFSEEGCD